MQGIQFFFDEAFQGELENETAIISLGVAFGEQVRRRGHFSWVRLVDEFGEETVLVHDDAEIILSPVSMIKKRIDERDHYNLDELCNGAIAQVDELIETGNYTPR